jgi:integrase
MSIQNIGRNHWRITVKARQANASGKHKYISRRFKGTKDEAIAFEGRLRAQSGSRSNPLLGMKFKPFVTVAWLPSLMVKQSTIKDYKYGLKLLEPLSDHNLDEITAYDIETAIHSLPAGDARSRALRTLKAALNAAVRWDYLVSSPVAKARITIGEGRKVRHEPYDIDELAAVIELFAGDYPEAAIIIAAYCGLGKEEVLALDWEDLLIEKDEALMTITGLDLGVIHVQKAWVLDGTVPVERGTKNTHRERAVYIAGDALERLRDLRKDKTGPIWPGVKYPRIRPDAATRHIKDRVVAAGLRYIPLNSFRHTYATMALKLGIDIATISLNLGHSQKSTTVNRYIKTYNNSQMQAASVFAQGTDLQKSYKNLPQRPPKTPKTHDFAVK